MILGKREGHLTSLGSNIFRTLPIGVFGTRFIETTRVGPIWSNYELCKLVAAEVL